MALEKWCRIFFTQVLQVEVGCIIHEINSGLVRFFFFILAGVVHEVDMSPRALVAMSHASTILSRLLLF